MDSNQNVAENKHISTNSPRQNLIDTAVNFLQHRQVKNTLPSQQRAFLSKKGLTDEEIDLAVQKAGLHQPYYPSRSTQDEYAAPILMHRQSVWTKLYGISSAFIVFGISIYGLQYFYKYYLEPWLSGSQRKSHLEKLEEQILEVNRSVAELRQTVLAMQESIGVQKADFNKCLDTLKADQELMLNPLKFAEVQTEIGTIKSLLLSRHQFPDVPKLAPSIPVWQLSSNPEENSDETKEVVVLSENNQKSNESDSESTEEQSDFKICNKTNTETEKSEEENKSILNGSNELSDKSSYNIDLDGTSQVNNTPILQ